MNLHLLRNYPQKKSSPSVKFIALIRVREILAFNELEFPIFFSKSKERDSIVFVRSAVGGSEQDGVLRRG